MKDKEKKKMENYQDMKRELKRIWKLPRVTVVPVDSRNCLERHRKVISRDWCHMLFRIIAESVLARILRKVLDT